MVELRRWISRLRLYNQEPSVVKSRRQRRNRRRMRSCRMFEKLEDRRLLTAVCSSGRDEFTLGLVDCTADAYEGYTLLAADRFLCSLDLLSGEPTITVPNDQAASP